MNTTDNAMMNTMNNATSANNAIDESVEYKKYCFKTPYDFDAINDKDVIEEDNWKDEIYQD